MVLSLGVNTPSLPFRSTELNSFLTHFLCELLWGEQPAAEPPGPQAKCVMQQCQHVYQEVLRPQLRACFSPAFCAEVAEQLHLLLPLSLFYTTAVIPSTATHLSAWEGWMLLPSHSFYLATAFNIPLLSHPICTFRHQQPVILRWDKRIKALCDTSS